MHKEFRVNRSSQVVLQGVLGAMALGLVLGVASPASGRVLDGDMKAFVDSSSAAANAAPGTLRGGGHGPFSPQAVPEINGPGRVSTVGNVWHQDDEHRRHGQSVHRQLVAIRPRQWPGPSGVRVPVLLGPLGRREEPGGAGPDAAAARRARHRVASAVARARGPHLPVVRRTGRRRRATFDDDGDAARSTRSS